MIRNEIWGITEHYFKWNNEPAGIIAQHNTNGSSFYTTPHSNCHLRNNLFFGGTNSTTITPELHTMDYDGFGSNIFSWAQGTDPKLTYVGLANFTAATGYEANGIMISRDDFVNAPEYVAGTTLTPDDFDLRLTDGSEAIDSALRLPNINDDYLGEGPDRGALEFGVPPPHYGPRTDSSDHTLTVLSAPSPGVSIAGTHPGDTPYTASVSDGTEVILTAPAFDGALDFSRWADSEGELLSTSRTLAFSMVAEQPSPSPLYAGTAKVDITPPAEDAVDLTNNDLQIHENIDARVVVLKTDDVSLAIVSLDLILFSSAKVVADAKAQWGVDHVILSSTHTHSTVSYTHLRAHET